VLKELDHCSIVGTCHPCGHIFCCGCRLSQAQSPAKQVHWSFQMSRSWACLLIWLMVRGWELSTQYKVSCTEAFRCAQQLSLCHLHSAGSTHMLTHASSCPGVYQYMRLRACCMQRTHRLSMSHTLYTAAACLTDWQQGLYAKTCLGKLSSKTQTCTLGKAVTKCLITRPLPQT